MIRRALLGEKERAAFNALHEFHRCGATARYENIVSADSLTGLMHAVSSEYGYE